MCLFILARSPFGIPQVLHPFVSLFTHLFISVSRGAKTNDTVRTPKELIIWGERRINTNLLTTWQKK